MTSLFEKIIPIGLYLLCLNATLAESDVPVEGDVSVLDKVLRAYSSLESTCITYRVNVDVKSVNVEGKSCTGLGEIIARGEEIRMDARNVYTPDHPQGRAEAFSLYRNGLYEEEYNRNQSNLMIRESQELNPGFISPFEFTYTELVLEGRRGVRWAKLLSPKGEQGKPTRFVVKPEGVGFVIERWHADGFVIRCTVSEKSGWLITSCSEDGPVSDRFFGRWTWDKNSQNVWFMKSAEIGNSFTNGAKRTYIWKTLECSYELPAIKDLSLLNEVGDVVGVLIRRPDKEVEVTGGEEGMRRRRLMYHSFDATFRTGK